MGGWKIGVVFVTLEQVASMDNLLIDDNGYAQVVQKYIRQGDPEYEAERI